MIDRRAFLRKLGFTAAALAIAPSLLKAASGAEPHTYVQGSGFMPFDDTERLQGMIDRGERIEHQSFRIRGPVTVKKGGLPIQMHYCSITFAEPPSTCFLDLGSQGGAVTFCHFRTESDQPTWGFAGIGA